MEQPQISKSEDSNFITREEVRILINRFQEKISQLEEKLEVLENRLSYGTTRLDKRHDTESKRIKHLQKEIAICKSSGLANKQQIDALYNIQLYGKPN